MLKQTDKALSSIKNSLEQIEGTLRGALNSTGTNARATSTFSFRNATTGAADASQLLAEAATGTTQNRLQAGDTVQVNLVRVSAGGTTTVVGTGTALTTTTTTTVQNLLDNINNSTTPQPDRPVPARQRLPERLGQHRRREHRQRPRCRVGDTFALQFVVNTAGGTGVQNNALDVFAFSGAVGGSPTSSGTGTQTVQMLGGSTVQTTRDAAAASFGR